MNIAAAHNVPPPWAAGAPGAKHHRPLSLSPQSQLALALDAISANEVEREVADLVCRVRGTAAAIRVIRGFREPEYTGPQLNLW